MSEAVIGVLKTFRPEIDGHELHGLEQWLQDQREKLCPAVVGVIQNWN